MSFVIDQLPHLWPVFFQGPGVVGQPPCGLTEYSCLLLCCFYMLHSFLMVIGFIVMGGKVQKLVHLLFLLIAFVSGILGVSVVFKFHHEVGLKYWLFAFFSFWCPGAGMPTRARHLWFKIWFRIWVVFYCIV
ncbi:hypothetical protein MKW94_001459 [Papaver nudicaule]|uniref:Uncharacterized protein n=1 Tax=Papaver nudicaule TaxID=74823 RepID=A0AA41RSR7_PAPNU|nr:hypothetical protein [Papaver nudicaule]